MNPNSGNNNLMEDAEMEEEIGDNMSQGEANDINYENND